MKFDNWFEKFTVEKSVGLFSATIIMSGSLILCLSLLLSPWIKAAYSAGADNITLQICDLRKGNSVITTAKLLDGTVISGLLLDRSDKFTAITDAASVHVLTVGDKPQLLYSIQLRKMKCPA
ncbi:hypothetical protein CFter6_2859 [Collimonas fungivorans]|uniref:Uncharacterized protein n=2 Tax=Collimonas fungivorans TaxID=158899 RepID=A0A127PCY1_9BURK|nr:hypothetical protein CFter6_2859 [Collimonas fungivorans]